MPMSSKYDKYLKLYNDIKSKKGIEPNNFVFARNLAGKKAVFLIQNMFPTLEKYIEQEYKKAGISIKVPKAVKEEINKKLEIFLHLQIEELYLHLLIYLNL